MKRNSFTCSGSMIDLLEQVEIDQIWQFEWVCGWNQAWSPVCRATNPMHRATPMRRACVFFTLWRAAQWATPLKLAQFAAIFLFFLQHTPSLVLSFLFRWKWALWTWQMIYIQKILIFRSQKPTFVMFAFWLAFQTLFLGSLIYFCLWWTKWFDLLFSLQVMEMLKAWQGDQGCH